MHTMLRDSPLAQRERIESIREAQHIIFSLLDIAREKQLSYPEQEIEEHDYERAMQACQKRASGHPIAYVLGQSFFYKHDFVVNEHVLIPRPETERLVELCLSITQDAGLCSRIARNILDCGTGSGCIGISLAAELAGSGSDPDGTGSGAGSGNTTGGDSGGSWKIAMSDIKAEALDLARTNIERILSRPDSVRLYQDSLLDKVVHGEFQVGIIVANLPYLCLDQISFSNISKEPLSALSDKSLHGMKDITKLLHQASQLPYPHIVLLEFDPSQLDSIVRILSCSKYIRLQDHQDLRGIVRFLSCQNFSFSYIMNI